MSYTTANIALDFLLLAFLSSFMLSRNGWAFAAVMIMVIVPYALPLPEGAHQLAARPPAVVEAQADPAERTLNPVTSPGDVAALYGQVSGGLGGDPAASTRQINQEIDRMSGANPGIEAAAGARKATAKTLTDITTKFDASWLFIRAFWCVAAFMLLLQRTDLGIVAFCAALVPVPWLALGLPYWADQLQQMQFVAATDAMLENPTYIAHWVREHVALFLFFVVMGGLGIFVGTRISNLINSRKAGRLERFLNPARYQLRMSNQTMDFWVEDDSLVADNIRLSLANVRVDREDPSIWILGSGTRIEFIARD